MYLPLEMQDHDACALSRELMGFSLKEEDDWVSEHKSTENSGCGFKSTRGHGPSAERKILFQHDTVLDRHMVSDVQSNLACISNLARERHAKSSCCMQKPQHEGPSVW